MYSNEIVGFDAREMWLDVHQQWTQDRKAKFLIRQDVSKPLSVDSYIWYAVFSEVKEPHLWASIARDAKYIGETWNRVFSESRKVSKPDNAFQPRRVWRNLAQLKSYLNQKWGDLWKACWLISVVEVFEDDGDIGDQESFDPITPQQVDSTWQLLGYDVADYELFTGLFEGEIDPNEAQNLRTEWANYLNEYHLFIEPQKAFEYINVANKRYPSHMPYGVYALYLVENHSAP